MTFIQKLSYLAERYDYLLNTEFLNKFYIHKCGEELTSANPKFPGLVPGLVLYQSHGL